MPGTEQSIQKILIVDDVPANIKILHELLAENHELYVATNGKKAIEVAEAKLPDLILMDVTMPEIDGFTACALLKHRVTTAEIPVIFITAKSDIDDMVKGFDAGGADYVTKPFNPSELNARVMTHLELKRSREQLQTYRRQLKGAIMSVEERSVQNILIVDDEPANIKILRELLAGNYALFVATNGRKATEVAEAKLPDLILMDVMMPEIDGITACKLLKSHPLTAEIPVIFITAKSDVDDMVKGFEAGGVDYVTKPFNPSELNARVKTHLELKRSREQLQTYGRQLEEANKQLENRNELLNDAIEKLHQAATTDPLTGLRNRRYMETKIEEEIVRSIRTKRTFSLILTDIDHFKNVNDQYGHECGDQVLKCVSEVLLQAIREQDHLARWGGEEFLFLLPETDVTGALVLAEKLRSSIEEGPVRCQERAIGVTMTFGVSAYDQSGSMDKTIREADRALYMGKRLGRNRVVRV